MNYIIFDLEFNGGKNRFTGKNINEIIEIGAVKLDKELNETDSYSALIRPVLTESLNPYVKKLTNITEKELKAADTFINTIESFIDFCGDPVDNIFCSWSNSDLFVMLENYVANLKKDRISFIMKYFDLQKYATRNFERTDNNQISLKNAAEMLNIDTESFSLHRATDDSRVCAEMLRRTFVENELDIYIKDTTVPDYYKRLIYKPHYITELGDPGIDKNAFCANCPVCKTRLTAAAKTSVKGPLFFTTLKCGKCGRKYMLSLKFRKLYDTVEVKKRLKEYKPRPDKNKENKQ